MSRYTRLPDQAIALLTNDGASTIGTITVPGMVVTISVYDKRGQNIQTREPLRQLSPDGIGYNTTTIIHSRSYNAFGEVSEEIDPNAYASNDTTNDVTDFTYNTMGRRGWLRQGWVRSAAGRRRRRMRRER